MRYLITAVFLFLLGSVAVAADTTDRVDFKELFNGSDLSGWEQVNCARETFTVKDGMIVCTGVPTGVIRTDRMYENFILELDWKHLKPKGNAGLFVWSDALTAPGVPFTRSIEVQILDGRNTESYTSHGDVFAIHGAKLTPDRPHPNGSMRCLPSERRCKPAGEWNHYRVTCRDGVLKLAVNGKVVSGGSKCTPKKGYICLESEGSPVHFRNIRIHELPSTGAKPEETADKAEGFKTLYTGLNLSGWKTEGTDNADHWKPADWRLRYDGKSKHATFETEDEFGDFELVGDWRLTAKPTTSTYHVDLPDGSRDLREFQDAGGSGIRLRGSGLHVVEITSHPRGSGGLFQKHPNDGDRIDPNEPVVLASRREDNAPGRWNRFRITLRGDRLTVRLNGKTVIDDKRVKNLPKRGPVALQNDAPIEFANLFVRSLHAP